MMQRLVLSHAEVKSRAESLAMSITRGGTRPRSVYGVPRGGVPVAYLMQGFLPELIHVVESPELAEVIVDDLIDSGLTKARYAHYEQARFVALFDKKADDDSTWYVFPWETPDTSTTVVDKLIRTCQEYGVIVTPTRLAQAASLLGLTDPEPQVKGGAR